MARNSIHTPVYRYIDTRGSAHYEQNLEYALKNRAPDSAIHRAGVPVVDGFTDLREDANGQIRGGNTRFERG